MVFQAGGSALSRLKQRLSGSSGPKAESAEWQTLVFDLYDKVSDAVKELTDHDVFLVYGSLLGAVREGGFLSHDYDFDCAYVSGHTDPHFVRLEFTALAFELQRRGFNVEGRYTCIHIWDADRKDRIDLYYLYFDNEGVLQFPFGVAGVIDFVVEDWQGTREVLFSGKNVLVPSNAEKLVEVMYGPNWPIPDLNWDWGQKRRIRSPTGRMLRRDALRLSWQDFYKFNRFDSPSSFALFVSKTIQLPGRVVDIGCGDGRDGEYFAGLGLEVHGLDWSENALEIASGRVPGGSFSVVNFNDGSDAVASAIRTSRSVTPTLFYGRFLLHAIFVKAQEDLLNAISDVAVPGDCIALEFRGLADADRPHNRPWMVYRRFINPEQVREQLGERGYEIVSDVGGTGWSPLGKEDPYLHRIIARR
ncbi:MAG: class I SAM-dependent methyltransferase [Propionibacteriaceae bacterium]|jgi:SAM-dependent methyltransferase|nr:class I SAM-dependent methyltransferase [Propionibacteriaceae bacterium]